EIARCDDHEAVQIQFQTEALFVPLDRAFKAVQCPCCLVVRIGVAIYLQQSFAAAARANTGLSGGKLSSDQGKQIAWFWVRVLPYGLMTAVVQYALTD